MMRAAKQKNAHSLIFAEGYTMKERFVIRLNRKNELNAAWVFLILSLLVYLLLALIARTLFQEWIIIVGCMLIVAIALVYQGFEVVKEK